MIVVQQGDRMAAERRIDMKIVCPFYMEVYGRVIRCSPINEAVSTDSRFRSIAARNAHIEDFCACGCWQGCTIAQLCMKKYDEETQP